MLSGHFPDRVEDALSFVIARAFLVRLAEITNGDGSVHGRNDFAQLDGAGIARQHVAAADAALGTHETRALEGQQDLFEIGLRQPGAFSDVPNRSRPGGLSVDCQRQKSPTGIITTR